MIHVITNTGSVGHLSQDGQRTLCGRVAHGEGTMGRMCKRCEAAAQRATVAADMAREVERATVERALRTERENVASIERETTGGQAERFEIGSRVALSRKPMITGTVSELWRSAADETGIRVSLARVAWTDGMETDEMISSLILAPAKRHAYGDPCRECGKPAYDYNTPQCSDCRASERRDGRDPLTRLTLPGAADAIAGIREYNKSRKAEYPEHFPTGSVIDVDGWTVPVGDTDPVMPLEAVNGPLTARETKERVGYPAMSAGAYGTALCPSCLTRPTGLSGMSCQDCHAEAECMPEPAPVVVWRMVDMVTGETVTPGERKDFRGKVWRIVKITRTPEPGKSGKVRATDSAGWTQDFYPSVFGLTITR